MTNEKTWSLGKRLGLSLLAAAVAPAWSEVATPGYELNLAELSLDELMRVEVTTASKVPEQIRDTPASVYLVGREDIERYGYQSLTEILKNVPGFYNISNYAGVSGNFGVRGFWNGRSQNSSVAILINGAPQMKMDSWSHPMELLNVPVEAIDRVEVIRGPNSVIYGNGAAFGAINIITDESYHENQISASVGSRGRERVAARWSTYGTDSHLIVNAGHVSTDGLDPRLSELMSAETAAMVGALVPIDLDHSLAGRLESQRSYLQLSGAWRDFFGELVFNDSDTEIYFTLPAVTEGSLRQASDLRLSLGHATNRSSDVSLSNRFTFSRYDEDLVYDAVAPGFVAFNYREYDHYDWETLLHLEPSEAVHFTGGLNLQRMHGFFEYTHVPALGITNEVVRVRERDTYSIFGQFNWQATERLRVVGGYRLEELTRHEREVYLDYHDPDRRNVSGTRGGHRNGTPRLSLIYQPDEGQVWKLMAGDAIKNPEEAYGPEKVRTVELNYTRSSGRSLLGISLFRNTVRNLVIENLDFSIPPETDALMTGEMETAGVEAQLTLDLSERLRMELAGSYQDPDSDGHPAGIASYSPEKVAHLKLAYEGKGFHAALLGRYVDSMHPFYSAGVDSQVGGRFIGDKIEGYVTFDASLRWDDLWEGLYLAVQATNLLDESIRYPNNPYNSAFLDRGLVGPGRGFLITVGSRF